MKNAFVTTLIGLAALANGVLAAEQGTCREDPSPNFRIMTSRGVPADRGAVCMELFDAFKSQCQTWPDTSTVLACDKLDDGRLWFKVSGDPVDCNNDKLNYIWYLGTGNEWGEVHCG